MPAAPHHPPLITGWRIVQRDGQQRIRGVVFDHPLYPDATEITTEPVDLVSSFMAQSEVAIYSLGKRAVMADKVAGDSSGGRSGGKRKKPRSGPRM